MPTPGAGPGLPPAAQCVVCGVALTRQNRAAAAADDPYPSCFAIACRMVVGKRSEMVEPLFRDYLRLQSLQRREHKARSEHAQRRSMAEVRDNDAAFAAMLGHPRVRGVHDALRLVIPSGPRRLAPLSQRRRERYRNHVLAIIGEAGREPVRQASAAAAPDRTKPATNSSLPGRLCGLCGGGCCTHGSDTAYLTAGTIRRILAQRPGTTREDLLAAYLDAVRPKTVAGSCINHAAGGCSLPREIRSDVCNRYACAALEKVEAALKEEKRPPLALVIRRRQDRWNQTNADADNGITALALLAEDRVARVRTPAPLAGTGKTGDS